MSINNQIISKQQSQQTFHFSEIVSLVYYFHFLLKMNNIVFLHDRIKNVNLLSYTL